MRDYVSGQWGFALLWGIEASVCPRAFAIAFPNFVLTYILAVFFAADEYVILKDEVSAENAVKMLSGFTAVMFFVLYFRSNIAYARWWEGGTLLQKTRGEWFNAYSSLMAFTSLDPGMSDKVEEFQHMIARLMSLLFCCALQQVSPSKERPFEVLDLTGIEESALLHLNDATDKVEVILQWIQRATVVHAANGVLPVAPPILSRAFQEVSRGIVNLQNARKIADFPFPFPYAQVSMWMLLLHWCATPMTCVMLFKSFQFSRILAAGIAFFVIFFVWCINFIALSLEAPFGKGENDLPMMEMQRDWNKSISVLLAKWAHTPPKFQFDAKMHCLLETSMSDGSLAKQPSAINPQLLFGAAKFGTAKPPKNRGRSTFVTRSTGSLLLVADGLEDADRELDEGEQPDSPKVPSTPVSSSPPAEGSGAHKPHISTTTPPERKLDVDAGPSAGVTKMPEAVHGFMPPDGNSFFGLPPDFTHSSMLEPDDEVNRFINDSLSFPKVMPLWSDGIGRGCGPSKSAIDAGLHGSHCIDSSTGYSPRGSRESGGQLDVDASQRGWPANFETDLQNSQPHGVHVGRCMDSVAGHSRHPSRGRGSSTSSFEVDTQEVSVPSAPSIDGTAGYREDASNAVGHAGGPFGSHNADGASGYTTRASRLRREGLVRPGVDLAPTQRISGHQVCGRMLQTQDVRPARFQCQGATRPNDSSGATKSQSRSAKPTLPDVAGACQVTNSSAPARSQSPNPSRVDVLLDNGAYPSSHLNARSQRPQALL